MGVVAIRAGLVRLREGPMGDWTTAIVKETLVGPVYVGFNGICLDAQADRKNHGGADKAVLAYCRDHYPHWQSELNRPDFEAGSLGENLEIEHQSEADVCIGDTYRIGDIVVQVSQPRQPCWKPAMLHNIPELTALMASTGRTGWYYRVLSDGIIESPAELQLLARPHPEWTVHRANRLVYQKVEPPSAKLELAALPELSIAWKSWLGRDR